jgi:hypothetical protein
MEFDIDVSGEDLLSKDYVVCTANKDGIIKGFKFSDKLVRDLSSRYGQGFYRYKKSKKGKSDFKLRLYCITIFYLFKSINLNKDISLNICRDFQGKENDIKENIKSIFKKNTLKFPERIYFVKLLNNSNAHKYAFLMREDRKDKLSTYVDIKLKDFEKWLKK